MGWISKTAPDEPGYEISSPESGPRAHTHTHMPAHGRQVVEEKRRMAAPGELFSGGISSNV